LLVLQLVLAGPEVIATQFEETVSAWTRIASMTNARTREAVALDQGAIP